MAFRERFLALFDPAAGSSEHTGKDEGVFEQSGGKRVGGWRCEVGGSRSVRGLRVEVRDGQERLRLRLRLSDTLPDHSESAGNFVYPDGDSSIQYL